MDPDTHLAPLWSSLLFGSLLILGLHRPELGQNLSSHQNWRTVIIIMNIEVLSNPAVHLASYTNYQTRCCEARETAELASCNKSVCLTLSLNEVTLSTSKLFHSSSFTEVTTLHSIKM